MSPYKLSPSKQDRSSAVKNPRVDYHHQGLVPFLDMSIITPVTPSDTANVLNDLGSCWSQIVSGDRSESLMNETTAKKQSQSRERRTRHNRQQRAPRNGENNMDMPFSNSTNTF